MSLRTAKIILFVLIVLTAVLAVSTIKADTNHPGVTQITGIESPLGPIMIYKIRVTQTGVPQYVYVAVSSKDVNASITLAPPVSE